MISKQEDIQVAFDELYKTRGFRYLRPREAYEIFRGLLSPGKGEKFLDVACGPGLLLKEMAKAGAISYGIDISPQAVNMSKQYCPEAEVVEANAEYLPFQDKEFKYISCIGSLERMIDRKKAIREQIRVATDDAKFCYMVRNSNHLSWKMFMKPLKLYNRKTHQDAMDYQNWCDLFKSCGLRILSVYPDHWPYYRLRKLIPIWNRNIDYSKIRKFPFSLNRAYEFIFLLEKDD
jgi:ubiquinone/menaquinone biosynthesis C-methylase UbiE